MIRNRMRFHRCLFLSAFLIIMGLTGCKGNSSDAAKANAEGAEQNINLMQEEPIDEPATLPEVSGSVEVAVPSESTEESTREESTRKESTTPENTTPENSREENSDTGYGEQSSEGNPQIETPTTMVPIMEVPETN